MTTSRAERVAEAQRLRAEGLLIREIAERMGAKMSTVGAWLNDPNLSKQRARRDGYAGTCVDCGVRTDGSDGSRKAPTRCRSCNNRLKRRWTSETIIAAMRAWADEHGGIPPAATDWNSSMARDAGRIRRDTDRFPSMGTVQAWFGSWNAAIRSAGFDAFASGHYGRQGEDPAIIAETVRLYRSGLSLVQVADAMGVSRGAIRYRLQKAGEPRRPAHHHRRESVAA